ncbi:MAG: CDP-glycerol glycerophosphotransferase family protein [Candidatus Harrisonbacteria bacterium]|nr:CDP-glycerol glycerophosphotransferase family protein [Candidatus Harrisonbacteria bacterium]
MKTIFITSLNPFITRNILFTDVFETLRKAPATRLVIFCPDYKLDYFRGHFSAPNVIVEGIKPQQITKQDVFFRYVDASFIDNNSRYIHQRRELLRDKNYPRFLASRFLARAGSLRWIQRLARWVDLLTIQKNKFAGFFDKYRPNLVFAPDIFHDDDVHFLAEAKRRKIKTVGMVRSWDNITNKGLCRVKPDKLVVNNEILKSEAVRYEDMRPDDVAVVGMPQTDYYLKETRTPRTEFFKRINLDPNKRLIMFSPHGNRFHDTDWQIMQILKEARLNGELPENVQFLVRFPPNDDVAMGNFKPDSHFFIDRPAKMFQEGIYRDQELDGLAMLHLADSLHYSELVVTYNSSIIIDAAAFGKPSVGVAFDGWEKKPDIYRSVARFMDYDHTQHILKTGGLWITRDRNELINAVSTYLKNPKHNLENRQKIVDSQIWKFDGRAGKRIAEFIYSLA